MKTFFKSFLLLSILSLILIGCGKNSEENDSKKDTDSNVTNVTEEKSDKKKVTTTTSFLYDMVNQLVGDKVYNQMIVPAGEDPHLYIAKPKDLDKINNADLVLYHGMHFEGKMVDALEKVGHSVSENFPKDKVEKMDDDGEEVIDPHFWFDIDLYKIATENASKKLIELLPEEKENIEKNTKDYLAKLDDLNKESKEAIASIPKEQRFLITPHDAFNYFSRSFDIPVMAPQGVSTDSEVANKDIDETVDFIVQNKVKAIFAESTTDPARMEKLKEATKAKGFDVKVVSGEGNELFSDSLAPEGQEGDNFIDMVKHNVKLIVDNLK